MKRPTTKQRAVLLSLADNPAVRVPSGHYRLENGQGAYLSGHMVATLIDRGWATFSVENTRFLVTPEGLKAVQEDL